MKYILTLLCTCMCMHSADAWFHVDAWPHYSSIGYDLQKYISENKDNPSLGLAKFYTFYGDDPATVHYPVANDLVSLSATPCGAELWAAAKYNDQLKANESLGFVPHFFGSSRIALKVEERNEDDSECNAWLNANADGSLRVGSLEFNCLVGSLEFNCPNYLLYKKILKDRPNVIVQMAAFAEEIETYDSVEKYYEEQLKLPFKTSSKSFGHLSVFEPEKTCKAVLSGHVLETELKVNEKTGESFYWALIDTLHGQMDVVVDHYCYEINPPKVGGVIYGAFWLSGRIMNEGELE